MSTVEVELDNEEQKELIKKILNVFDSSVHPVKAAFALANSYKIICDNCGLEMPSIDILVSDMGQSSSTH